MSPTILLPPEKRNGAGELEAYARDFSLLAIFRCVLIGRSRMGYTQSAAGKQFAAFWTLRPKSPLRMLPATEVHADMVENSAVLVLTDTTLPPSPITVSTMTSTNISHPLRRVDMPSVSENH